MATYTIGQVAERTGFSASALRYYEDHGLLAPVDRTGAGYRLYDDTSLARLGFVARAKELGCSLGEIADLAELWAADDCGPVQRRLHALVTDKIADAQRRSAALIRLTAQLQTAAAHLGADPVDGPCGPGCACLGSEAGAAAAAAADAVDAAGAGDPSAGEPAAAVAAVSSDAVPVVLGDRAGPAISCTLDGDEVPGRIADWQRLLGHAVRREALPATGVRVLFGPSVPLDELARLAAAEQGCCTFFAFAITIDDRGTALEVRAPAEAADLVAAVFGSAP